jgi:hypothetical protein
MEALETEQQFYDYVSNYADFLEISITEDGEKEVIEKEISLHSIAPFLNTDRIIQIKDTYQKFIGNIAIESGDYNELKKVTDSKKVSGLEYKEVYQIISGVNDAMAKTHVGTILSWEAMKDQRGCKNDRKAILAAYFVDESFTIFGVNIIQIRPQINVIARRKGIPCIWYDYQTNITWNNFYVEYSIDFAPNVVWTEADQTIYASSITRPHDLIDFSDSPDVTWKRIKSNVTTTGLGTSSLTVDF